MLTFMRKTDHSWQVENDYCLLLALPCGRDQEDVLGQTQALKSGFITYLQAKQAAGIINVPNPGSNQVCGHWNISVLAFFFVCLFDNEISWKCSSLSHHVMFIFGFTASLCGADFPAVWIFGEPPFAPGTGPSQQHLQHFPSPHDCHCRCLITSIFFLEQSQHQPFWTRPVL